MAHRPNTFVGGPMTNRQFRGVSDVNAQAKQPIRRAFGATDPGPRNLPLDEQNPDILVPPETDSGSLPNLKFSFGLAELCRKLGDDGVIGAA
jgi:hypothetical protein